MGDLNYRSEKIAENAVCIRGYDRSVDNAEIISRSIVSPLAADVFAVVQTDSGAAPDLATKLKAVAGDHRNYSPDEILGQMEAEGFNRTFWLSVGSKNALAPLSGTRGSALLQYMSLKRCYDLISGYELNQRQGRRYQHIVIVRSDHWCAAQPFCLTKPGAKESILIPRGMDWGGLNDRLIAFPREAAKPILTGAWQKLTGNRNRTIFSLNTERVHLANVQETNFAIVRTNVTCFIACKPGKSQTSWSPCSQLPEDTVDHSRALDGLKGMKYRDEFFAAFRNRNSTCQ